MDRLCHVCSKAGTLSAMRLWYGEWYCLPCIRPRKRRHFAIRLREEADALESVPGRLRYEAALLENADQIEDGAYIDDAISRAEQVFMYPALLAKRKPSPTKPKA